MQKTKFKVTDLRKNPDFDQIQLLKVELKRERIDPRLQKSKSFFGKYSLGVPNKLEVRIIDGKVGEGELKNKAIQIQLPPMIQAIQQLKEMLSLYFRKLTDKNCREIFWALTVSTIFHEAVHMLLDSRPGSKFTDDFEQISGFKNTRGEASTLLDEGLVYAIQGIYSKSIMPIGSLRPEPKNSDSQSVKIRKRLGMYLAPKVEEYFQKNQSLDNEFFSFAAKQFDKLTSYK